MDFLLYRSECIAGRFKFYDIEILRTALRNNMANGITGFLHRNRTHYFQYIEGEATQLNRLVENIKKDDRHTGFKTLLTGAVEKPRFPAWSMGYSDGLSEESSLGVLSASDRAEVIVDFLMGTAAAQREKYESNRAEVQDIVAQARTL